MEKVNYDELISGLESEIGRLGGQLAVARQTFIDEFSDRLSWFFENEARETATNQPDKTKAVGPEGLRLMKESVKALGDGAKSIAEDALNRREFWPDGLGSADWQTNRNTGEVMVPSGVDEAIRRAAGHLAPVLTKYGYVLGTVYSGSSAGFRRDTNRWDRVGWNSGDDERGPIAFPSSAEMQAALHECKNLAAALAAARQRLLRAKSDKEKNEAAQLWDGA